MTDLHAALDDYLALRRSLGFRLQRDEKLLRQFLNYLEHKGSQTVTIADALAWAKLPEPASPGWLGMRLSVVRSFAIWLSTINSTTEVPPRDLLPGRGRRVVPYLYSAADIAALWAQADRLKTPLRTATIRTVIGLLAATGMRIGEVITLDNTDFDLNEGLLVVRHAKQGNWRQIPLHPSTINAIQDYRKVRDQWFPRPVSPALLVSGAGTRLLIFNVGQTFARLVRRAGLAGRSGASRPRPHDLRHTFAVNTLLDWYRDGGDVAARLPLLSTYLGHTSPAHTYWYLQAAPELLTEAARRLDAGPAGPS